MVSRIVKPADRVVSLGQVGMSRDVAVRRFESEAGFNLAFVTQGELGPEADSVRTDHKRLVEVDGPTLRQVDDVGLGARMERQDGAWCRRNCGLRARGSRGRNHIGLPVTQGHSAKARELVQDVVASRLALDARVKALRIRRHERGDHCHQQQDDQ